ncbi:ATP-dependent DNA helicase PIF1-like protein [Tanacetum coccineum]
MTGDSVNDRTINSSLSNILNKSIFIQSYTTIRHDGRVHSYCGLKLADIPASSADLRQETVSGSKYAHTYARRRSAGIPAAYHNLSPPSYEYPGCHAIMWYKERNNKAKRAVNPTFSLCCQEGKVLLPRLNETPPPLKQLLDYKDTTTSRFKEQIRVYNSMFCFTSFGAKIDHSINTGRGPYTFRINGQNYHRMGSLLSAEGVQPRSFRMAKEWCHSNPSTDFGLRLLSERKTTRQYNSPTISEVAALNINDFGDGEPSRDIIVSKNNSGLQRISKLHPSYMALQYPLLFPYGEDGFHEHIPYHRNTGERKTKRGDQYLVDAYTAVEEQRLKWTRNNQDTLRVDLYHNLCDAVTRGDTSAAGLGKRIVLPRSFTRSPRYKAIKYLFKYLNKGPDRATVGIQENVKGVSRPLQLWEENWVALSDDILHKKQKLYRYPELQLTEEQLRNYCLLEIQELLNRHGKSLREFQDLPQPNPRLLTNLDNRLIREALAFDMNKSIASLLLPGGRTAHSRFDEAPMTQRYAFEALDKTLRDMLGCKSPGKQNCLFGGVMVLLRGDFRQILPVIPKAKRLETANCRPKKEAEDEPTWIQILEEFLIKSWSTPIENIVSETYPNFTTRQIDNQYLKERAILTPRNDDADAINEYMFNKLGGETVTYNSADEICLRGTSEMLARKGFKVDGVFDGAFGGVRDEEVVVGEGVVVTSSSLEMLTNSCLGGIMVSLIFLEGLEEEA